MSRNKPVGTCGNEGQPKGSASQKQGNPSGGGAWGQPTGSATSKKPRFGVEGQEAAGSKQSGRKGGYNSRR